MSYVTPCPTFARPIVDYILWFFSCAAFAKRARLSLEDIHVHRHVWLLLPQQIPEPNTQTHPRRYNPLAAAAEFHPPSPSVVGAFESRPRRRCCLLVPLLPIRLAPSPYLAQLLPKMCHELERFGSLTPSFPRPLARSLCQIAVVVFGPFRSIHVPAATLQNVKVCM